MPRRLNPRQLMAFLLSLIALVLFVIALIQRLPPAQVSDQAPVSGSAGQATALPGTAAPQGGEAAVAPAPTLDPVTASRCRDQVKSFLGQIDPIVSIWVDTRQSAGSAAQDKLAGEVEKLQMVRQQARALAVPVCAEQAYLSLLSSMDHTVKGYRGFLSELPDEMIRGELQQADQSFSYYVAQINQLR